MNEKGVSKMKSEYTYRIGGHGDLKELQELGLIAYGQFKSILSTENWEMWEEGFKSDTNFSNLMDIGSCFVCEKENGIVGMAFLIPSGNRFLHFQDDWAYIRYVGVHPKHEGNGIGKILTEKCIGKAKDKGEA